MHELIGVTKDIILKIPKRRPIYGEAGGDFVHSLFNSLPKADENENEP